MAEFNEEATEREVSALRMVQSAAANLAGVLGGVKHMMVSAREDVERGTLPTGISAARLMEPPAALARVQATIQTAMALGVPSDWVQDAYERGVANPT